MVRAYKGGKGMGCTDTPEQLDFRVGAAIDFFFFWWGNIFIITISYFPLMYSRRTRQLSCYYYNDFTISNIYVAFWVLLAQLWMVWGCLLSLMFFFSKQSILSTDRFSCYY